MLDKDYWSNRYKTNAAGWDIGYASPALIEYTKQYPTNNKILIPGAGNGHESLALAEFGYHNITVCDLSPIPLASIKKKDTSKSIKTIEDDFFKLEGCYDLILEQTFFCALDPILRIDYAKKMQELLGNGGRLAGVLFAEEFDRKGPPFGAKYEDYISIFNPYFDILTLEECYNSIPARLGNELFFEVKKKN